jgi:two-component system sensor histidine kinase YesM
MMGKYFQYITRNSNFPIAIEKEVDHARIYAEIQSLRFAGHISIVFDPLPENFIALTVPPLILQPLLENAFIHGLEDLEDEGKLHVSFAVLDQEGERVFRISVEDNGNLLPDEALMNLQSTLGGREMPQSLTGLLNINYRLKLLYQNSGCLQADRSELGGLRISILIPASGTAGEPSDA